MCTEQQGIFAKERITCRKILCFMVITCFMTQYMIRVNMSIAIVEMVSNNTTQWTEHEKNDILGCFFWGFLASAIPGGRLSEIYGTKIVLGTAMFVSSLLTLLTPLACINYYFVVCVRIALGLMLGVSWPSIPPLAIKWVAPEDIAKFMSHTIACNLGAAVALPFFGYLIAYIGWASVFYISGVIALIWSISWFYFVYDSPQQHPRISNKEKEAIQAETYCSSKRKESIPWLKILSSGPVWAIVVADICLQFNVNVILNDLPSYMDHILHYNIRQNGLLSSLPFLAIYILAIVFCLAADRLKKGNILSTIAIRKIFTSISFATGCVLYFIQIFFGYDRLTSIFVFTLSQGALAASTAGFISNSPDISPVYSGTVFGIAFTGGASTGYLSSKLVAFLTSEAVTFAQWKIVFWILIGINFFGLVFYNCFASAEIQKWNPSPEKDMELKQLQAEHEKINVVKYKL